MSDVPPGLSRISATHTACKCCFAAAPLYGVADFNKHCNVHDPFGLTGIPVYYYRCPQCGFIFTTAFDNFTRADFDRWIYNDQYPRVDPDYHQTRPRANADKLAAMFRDHKDLRILDYGGGTGLLSDLLNEHGFANVRTYDPHVPQFSARPDGRFELIVAFEVVEHATQPRDVFFEMISLLEGPGLLLFSTPIQPANINDLGMNWWFIGPRNGHLSIHTPQSLRHIASERNLRLVSAPSKVWHLLLGPDPPAFARQLNIPPPAAT
jgi:2-polyprenyl-6-hydroxyphenyl methylase/3-demethylubiquinone-9 3-methyltransferase